MFLVGAYVKIQNDCKNVGLYHILMENLQCLLILDAINSKE